MTLEALPEFARELLEAGRVGHLGLLDGDGRPRVLPVTFAPADGALWSAVDYKPKRVEGEELARVRWLRRRPQVTLTVDVYSEDWSRLAWVQVLGEVAVLSAAEGGVGLDALVSKYPQYRERRPGGPLLRLTPARSLCWSAGGG